MPSRRASATTIGAFTLGAIAISVVTALVLGSGRFFRDSTRWVIYFESSVEGLDEGAPVVFRGVTVGSVTEIQAYVDPVKKIFATPVYIELIHGTVHIASDVQVTNPVRVIDSWIKEDGLRAQLKTQSLITGKLYVDLGFHPGTPLDLMRLDPHVPEIPTVPTPLEEIEQMLQDVVARIANLPLEEIVENLNSTLKATSERMNDPKLVSAIANLDAALGEMRTLMAKVDGSYDEIDEALQATLERAQETLVTVDATIADARTLVEPGSPLQFQLISTLDQIGRAARAMRVLSESIETDPNQLIFGRRRSGDQQ